MELENTELKNWNELDEDKTNWILKEAEKMLTATYTASCDLDRKVLALLTINIALFTAAIGYGFTHKDDPVSWLVAFGLCIFISLLLLLCQSRTSKIFNVGNRPSDLMRKKSFISKTYIKMQQGYLIEIENRIKQNFEWNKKRCFLIDLAVYLLIAAPVVSLISGWIFQYSC